MGILGILYRRIRGLIISRPANFSWVEYGVAASSSPVSRRQIEWLKLQGLQAVLSLTEKPLALKWFEEAGELQYCHVPLRNHATPSIGQVEKAVAFLEEAHSDSRKVLVHCAAGLGRTGTVLAAYLVKAQGYGPAQAIARIRSDRPASIESFQEKAIFDYYEKIHSSD